MLCADYINTNRISGIHINRRFSFKTDNNEVTKVVRKLSAPSAPILNNTLSVVNKDIESNVYNNNNDINQLILMNEKNDNTVEYLNNNIQIKNDCRICSSCSSCLLLLNQSHNLTVAEASRFDQCIMLLSALTRTRESTLHWAEANLLYNFPRNYLRKMSLANKKNKHNKRNLYTMWPHINNNLKNNNTKNLSDNQQHELFIQIKKKKQKNYNKKKKNLTLKLLNNNYLHHYPFKFKTEDFIIKNIKKKNCDEMQSVCPLDCISPAICKQLFTISEDMNLLVRNITKEAKALVNAEM